MANHPEFGLHDSSWFMAFEMEMAPRRLRQFSFASLALCAVNAQLGVCSPRSAASKRASLLTEFHNGVGANDKIWGEQRRHRRFKSTEKQMDEFSSPRHAQSGLVEN